MLPPVSLSFSLFAPSLSRSLSYACMHIGTGSWRWRVVYGTWCMVCSMHAGLYAGSNLSFYACMLVCMYLCTAGDAVLGHQQEQDQDHDDYPGAEVALSPPHLLYACSAPAVACCLRAHTHTHTHTRTRTHTHTHHLEILFISSETHAGQHLFSSLLKLSLSSS
jgi:hypothetical protein